MGKSIRIDSAGGIDSNRFTLLNCSEKFRFSITAITLKLRASLCCKIASWLTFASPIASPRQLKALLHCGTASHGFGGLVQQLQDQSPEPLVCTVEGGSNKAVNRIELNRIDSFVALNRIESFSFLPNCPSLESNIVTSPASGSEVLYSVCL